jgi:hypothetical protein
MTQKKYEFQLSLHHREKFIIGAIKVDQQPLNRLRLLPESQGDIYAIVMDNIMISV